MAAPDSIDKSKQNNDKHLDASVLLGDTNAERTANKLRESSDKPATTAAPKPAVEWRSELQTTTAEITKLQGLDAKDPSKSAERHKLIEDIDKRFQKTLPLIQTDATGADSDLLVSTAKATLTKKDFDAIKIDNKIIDPNTATMDDIHNAILNAPDESTRKQLSRLGILKETSDVAMRQVDANYERLKAPIMASLDYANFLVKYKDGISQTPDGKVFTAGDIIAANMSREMAAMPQVRDIVNLANDTVANHQNLFLDSEKNPLLAIRDTLKAPGTIDNTIIRLKNANELAKDEFFNPENLQKKIDEAQKDKSPEGLVKLAALNDFTHARGWSAAYLGYAELSKPNPDFKSAFDHLTSAAKDPLVAQSMRDPQGQPNFDRLMQTALAGVSPTFAQTAVGYDKDMASATEHAAKIDELTRSGDTQGAVAELKKAGVDADAAILKGKALKDALGGEDGAKLQEEYDTLRKKANAKLPLTPEENAMMVELAPYAQADQAQAQAMFLRAQLDMKSNDHNAALAQLKDLAKVDPSYIQEPEIQKVYQDTLAAAQAGVDYDNSGFVNKAFHNAWDVVKEHPKLVAGAVAFGGAALTVATFGAAAPLTALAVGAIGGGILGTGAGAGLEVASGQENSVWHAVKDVAPAAFTGSATGAMAFGLAPVAAITGEGGAIAGAAAETANTEKYVLPGMRTLYTMSGEGKGAVMAANAYRTAAIFTPLNAFQTSEAIKSGQDKNIASATFDFVSGEAQAGLAGGLTSSLTRQAIIFTGTQIVSEAGKYALNNLPLFARWQRDTVTPPQKAEHVNPYMPDPHP